MLTLSPSPATRAITFAERTDAEPYQCCVCKRHVSDGGAVVASVEGVEVDGLACCENCALANAELTPILEKR